MPHIEWDIENVAGGPRVLIWGDVPRAEVDDACPTQFRVDWRRPAAPLSSSRLGERGQAYALSKSFSRAGLADRFTREEVTSTYVVGRERYVVSLIVGYTHDAECGATSPEEAAALALALVLDGPGGGTVWHVHDRETGLTWPVDQGRTAMTAAWRERMGYIDAPEQRPVPQLLSLSALASLQGCVDLVHVAPPCAAMSACTPAEFAPFPKGTRVAFPEAVERFPNFIVPAGTTATVTECTADGVWAHVDQHVPGLSDSKEWNGDFCWSSDDREADPTPPFRVAAGSRS